MSFLSRLPERIRKTAIDIVDYSEPNTPFIGLVGLVGFPFLYVILQYVFPQKYNDFILYVIGILFVLPQVFYRYFPARLKRHYPVYFFIGGFYTLPFFSFFMLLKNDGAPVWVLAFTGCLLFFIIIFHDWLVVTLMTLIACVFGWLLVLLLDGHPWNGRIDSVYLPIFVICYVGGLFLNHRKQAGQQARLSLMKSLSGTIAHEMRNPLTAITLAMENIQSTLPPKPSGLTGKTGNYLLSYDDLLSIHNVILESIENVKSGNRMIDSILSSLREGEIDKRYFRKCSVRQVISMALGTYSYKNPDQQSLIFTDVRDDFDFFGDREQIVYVLFNLINNALHYSLRKDFRIDIIAESTPAGNLLRVRDTGPGVPEELSEKIFSRFYSAGKQDGNGIGLSFCRRVVESFAGTIRCESVVDRWTEFTITLPKYDSKTVRSIKSQILKNKRILVVDDQNVNRLLHSRHLGEYDCQVDLAENGRQCLEMAAKTRYDMILIDIEMPILSGDESVKLLRSGFNMTPSMMLHYRDAVIVGVTALPEQEAVRRTLHVGMNECILKPLNGKLLENLFERYFFSESVAEETGSSTSLVGARILLADDNATVRKFVSVVLENHGCVVAQAENGRRVLELLDLMEFDLVIMDMEMPVMNGLECARNIRNGASFRQFRRFADIPIIALTGNNDPEAIEQVMAAGMNAHIGKPVSRHDLRATISFWLGHSRVQGTSAAGTGVITVFQAPSVSIRPAGRSGVSHCVIEPSAVDNLLRAGGVVLLERFFKLFRQDASGYLGRLEAAMEAGDLLLAYRASHDLKDAAANIGALKLHLFARSLNDLFRAGKWPDEVDWLQTLRLLVDEVYREFEALSGREAEVVADAVDRQSRRIGSHGDLIRGA